MNLTPWRRSLRQLIAVVGVGVWGWVLTGPAQVQAAAGALTQLAGIEGCVSEDGTGGAFGEVCTDGKGLDGAAFVAVSKNGKHVYVASFFSSAVAVFAREQ